MSQIELYTQKVVQQKSSIKLIKDGSVKGAGLMKINNEINNEINTKIK